ncbi:MAG TPA: tRNA (adenosine(37)-N6)-dimethylallyltransferase MiaA [Euzebyales bacterium]|nr:tRNA (adenosine(37)-N6)-dimethylallyltransferase MiaA [Euzebyales bacterium]
MTAQGLVTAIVGPTASGKSQVAAAAAANLGAEIVAVDAFTIYRGMDIGTDKPVAGAIRHHMVDVLDPSQECTAKWFQQRARAAISEVLARGRRALLVGGSGLYFRAVVDPLEFPPTDPRVRRAIEERYPDASSAHAALRAVDPYGAERLDLANRRRAIRALEVHELTGRPFSAFQVAWDRHESIYPDLQVIGLEVDRAVLSDRITRRVDAMLAAGWLDEAARLRSRGLSRTAAAAIGYAELWAHLDGACPLDEARERIIARTRRYAVRQLRWFAADPRVTWMDPTAAAAELLGRDVRRPLAPTCAPRTRDRRGADRREHDEDGTDARH